jgi:hypothetical protein
VIALVPMTTDPAQRFISQLGDIKYRFDIQYNDRSGVWTLSLQEDLSELVLFQGVPMLLGVDLLRPYNFNIGQLVMLDTSASLQDATDADFSDRVVLYWISPDEELVNG